MEGVERGERRHRKVRAYRQIDAADRDDNQKRKHHEPAVGGVLAEIGKIGRREVAVGADKHADDHGDEGDERNCALYPAFGENVGQNPARRYHEAWHALAWQTGEVE